MNRQEKVITPSEIDIATYWDRGYWISPKLISDEHIITLRKAVIRIIEGDFDGDGFYYLGAWEKPDDETAIRKIQNGWWVNDEVMKIVSSPVIGRIAAKLMKSDEARLWHDQVILKPGSGSDATDAGNVGWHQDYAYWQCTNTDNLISVWIALQDTDLNNGAMRTLACSHKQGVIENSNTFTEKNLDSLRDRFEEKFNMPWIDEPCILKAGQASFHHALCFHGSGKNLTDLPRLSVVGHYMPHGCAYKPHGQWHSNIQFLGSRPYAGQLFDNEYFPLAYSEALEISNSNSN